MSGNRIVAASGSSGKGNKTFTFAVFQVGLTVNCYDTPLTFKYKTYRNLYETFNLYPGECFDEDTEPFKELQIIADTNTRWQFTGYVDLDGYPYLVSTY